MSLATNIGDTFTRIGTEFKAVRILVSGSGTGDVSGLDTTATNLVDAVNEVLDAVSAGAGIDDGATGLGTTWSSTKIDTELDLKAPLASPALTGTPTAPTASGATNTTQLATTAFVQAAVTALINAAPGALDTLDELAAAIGDDANFAATVTTALAGKQPIDATLTAFGGLTISTGKLPYGNGSDTFTTTDLTTAGRALLDDADASAQLTTLGVSTFIKTLLDDADLAAATTTLGVGDTTTNFVTVFEAALV